MIFFKKKISPQELAKTLIDESEKLIEIYQFNKNNLDEIDRDTFEFSIKDQFQEYKEKIKDESIQKNEFKELYARIRTLYALLEFILIPLEIKSLNKKEWENIINPNIPDPYEIIEIDKKLGFIYEDEYNDPDPIAKYLDEIDSDGDSEYYSIDLD